ncbi:MAG: hypothetical protein RRY29_00250 [Desulfovibrionaceae bacterium]
MHIFFRNTALLLALCLFVPALTHAADAQAGKAMADKPAKNVERRTTIAVIHEGNDSIGARLATRLKETFNASNLFVLNDKDAPKVRLLLTTQPEFSTRPAVGSVYSAVWIFSQSDAHLGYLLARELGTLNMDDVDNLVQQLVERTDGVSVKYSYLFNN